jgi:hypothetical protein
MGANAQTSVPAFTAGQVLTAAQVTQINTGIPVFATSTERDAAFGGSGEKTLAEGQMAYLEDTNETQYYDGSSWAAVSAGGLVVVKAETAFSAVSSVTADGVFTSDYTNYRLVINYTTSTTGNIGIRLRASASSAATNYNVQRLELGDTSFNTGRDVSQTSFRAFIYSNGAYESAGYVDVFKPQLATPTNFLLLDNSSLGGFTTPYLVYRLGNHSTATAYDGIELLTESGTMTGSYTIYGYAK